MQQSPKSWTARYVTVKERIVMHLKIKGIVHQELNIYPFATQTYVDISSIYIF